MAPPLVQRHVGGHELFEFQLVPLDHVEQRVRMTGVLPDKHPVSVVGVAPA